MTLNDLEPRKCFSDFSAIFGYSTHFNSKLQFATKWIEIDQDNLRTGIATRNRAGAFLMIFDQITC